MPINYTTLMTHAGKLISRSTSYATLASTTLPADLQTIISTYGTGSTTYGSAQKPIEGLNQSYESFQSSVVAWRQQLLPYLERTLTDPDTVTSQMTGLTQTDIRSVLQELIIDMADNSQTIKGNTVTLGAVTAGSGNTGNGTALVDKVLDGYNAPLRNGFAHIKYAGINSELAVPSETMELVCTSDSFSGGGNEGSEQWSWTGGRSYPAFDYHSEGSGTGPGLTTAHSDTTVANLNFENFSVANTPDNWTIAGGAAGTTIFKETTTAKLYRGSAALRFTGNAATATIQVNQAVTPSQLRSRRRYLFTVRMFKDGSAPGAGNVVIKFTGTGYTAAASEQINIATTSLTGSYVLYSFYINLPATIPSDWKLTIAVTGTLASGANVYFDSASFSPVVYHGGVNCQLVSGSTPWTIGDRLTFTVANNAAGNFQEMFRKAYNCQLPSKIDATETLSDTLAA